MNAFEQWPENWHGSFDIVNIRFMITLLSNERVFEALIEKVKGLLSKQTVFLVHVSPMSREMLSLPDTVVSQLIHNP